MYDPHTRESRGFGFVTMETPEEADAAITALNATELFGKTMNVEKVKRMLPTNRVRIIEILLLISRRDVLVQGLQHLVDTTDHRSAANVS